MLPLPLTPLDDAMLLGALPGIRARGMSAGSEWSTSDKNIYGNYNYQTISLDKHMKVLYIG